MADSTQIRDMREWRGVIVQLVMTGCLTALALKSPDPYVLHTVVGILGASVGQAITRARGEAVQGQGPFSNGSGGGGNGGGGNASYGNYSGMMAAMPNLGNSDMKHAAPKPTLTPTPPAAAKAKVPTIFNPLWGGLIGGVTAIGCALVIELTLF